MMVTSKEVYQELRSALASHMKAEGFRRLSGGYQGWVKPWGAEYFFLWFQCNKWGWNAQWGSNFTLEFQMAPDAGDAMSFKGRRERLGELLEGFQELEELRVMNNAIIERLPGTLGNLAVTVADGAGKLYAQEGFIIDPEPAIYGRDMWLNYHSVEDVRMWAHYFENRLPYFITLFVEQRKSSQGLARKRFDVAMGQVQRATDHAERMRIFKAYADGEPDAYYRAIAGQWLADASRRSSRNA